MMQSNFCNNMLISCYFWSLVVLACYFWKIFALYGNFYWFLVLSSIFFHFLIISFIFLVDAGNSHILTRWYVDMLKFWYDEIVTCRSADSLYAETQTCNHTKRFPDMLKLKNADTLSWWAPDLLDSLLYANILNLICWYTDMQTNINANILKILHNGLLTCGLAETCWYSDILIFGHSDIMTLWHDVLKFHMMKQWHADLQRRLQTCWQAESKRFWHDDPLISWPAY